jgi:hypothetical protein
MKRVRRIDAEWLATCRPAARQEWGDRQHPGLRVRVGPREASFYYYSTQFDSRGKPKRVGYNLGRWPETTLEGAAEAMNRLRDAGPSGRVAERWTVRRVLEDLEKGKALHPAQGLRGGRLAPDAHSSWLNQVELWFSKIERDVIARGVFTSVTDLRRKLMRYIKQYNKTAKPVRWAYADPTRRIA